MYTHSRNCPLSLSTRADICHSCHSRLECNFFAEFEKKERKKYSNSRNGATPFFRHNYCSTIINMQHLPRESNFMCFWLPPVFQPLAPLISIKTKFMGKVLHICGKTKALHHCGNYCTCCVYRYGKSWGNVVM